MKIVTWNVNSLRVRLPQVMNWLEKHAPDVLCLQETKMSDDDFPESAIKDVGYEVIYSGQKTYNGVAMLSKSAASNVVTDLPNQDDPARRLLASTVNDIRILNIYVPNGQEVGSDKYEYKLSWLESLQKFVHDELAHYPDLVLLGDYNIAPEDRDVHDPKLWQGKILFSQPERAAFERLIQTGLKDSFRKFEQEPNSFSWWDYRAVAFRRNRGLRIDHILCSPSLYERCTACYVDKEPRKLERPSDHAPVVAEFEDP
ncbi:MAG: exodeoxyribonuclease III [Arenicellales bacterium]|nr:exodeoxyribonuclease III [Arenicellales bacterium]